MTSILTGFTGYARAPMGIVTLRIIIGEEPRTKTLMVSFMMIKLPLTYNVSIGQTNLNKLKAVVSKYHRSIKFPTSVGVGEAKSNPRESRQCYLAMTTLLKRARSEALTLDLGESNKPESQPEPTEREMEVPLDQEHPGKTTKVGSTLLEDLRIQLIEFLGQNNVVFAWSPSDIGREENRRGRPKLQPINHEPPSYL
ncbi:hypothetical protein GW17_00010777 [Ensete ventricosum]|nr:hypothetical protein GW17_00010777 [Ensete ventricosum]